MSNIRKLERDGRIIWTGDGIAALLGLGRSSAAVFCSRAVRRGDLVRVRRGIFVLPGSLEGAGPRARFFLSNLVQTPSYISLTSALEASDRTTQILRSACEAVSPVRTSRYLADGIELRYHRLPRALYFGFSRSGGAFVASPEKALLDAAHLSALGRYSLDVHAVEWDRFDYPLLEEMVGRFPARTRRWLANARGGA